MKLFNPDLVHFSMGGICLITKVFGLYQKKQLVTIHGISFLEARIIKNLRKKLAIYANEIIEHLLIPKNIIHISSYSAGQYKNKNKTRQNNKAKETRIARKLTKKSLKEKMISISI